MSSPFERLGLPHDADERAVKRAYAQRLRQTRPDEDPAGFQQLHAAYQAALAHCRDKPSSPPARAAEHDDGNDVAAARQASAEDASPAPMADAEPAAPPLPAFDPDHFIEQAFALAEAGDAANLQQWLETRPELWSLQRKWQLGRLLLRQLHEWQPPMPPRCLQILLGFFDLDHVLAGHDPLARLQLERRTRLAWQLQHVDRDTLADRLELDTATRRRRAGWIVPQLMRPFRWARVLWVGLPPANARQITELIDNLAEGHPEDFPANFDRRQLAFWPAAAERQYFTRPRLILSGLRCATWLLLAALLAPLLSRLVTGEVTTGSSLVAAAILMTPTIAWMLWTAWLLLLEWYLRPASIAQPRSPRFWLVPAACAASLLLDLGWRAGAGLLVLPIMWLAARRYWYRHPARSSFMQSGLTRVLSILALPVLHVVLNNKLGIKLMSFSEVFALVALIAWLAELRRKPSPRTG